MSKDYTGFKLKPMNEIFTAANPMSKSGSNSIYNLPIDKLYHFKNHPFRIYEGKRFTDMVESIKTNGVIIPIIVRPVYQTKSDNDEPVYEILSGHNRMEAAKAAGLDMIPSIIREGLTDEEALLIVTETNFIQRSFVELSHSERAITLAMHHDAIKKQGMRNDLINEIENMVNARYIEESATCAPLGHKLNTRDIIAQNYDMSKNTVARYLRINKLIPQHKIRLDNGELAIRTAVELSYLSDAQQQTVDEILREGNYTVNMKKAELLRAASYKKTLTREIVGQILAGISRKKKSASRRPAFKIKANIISKYFKPDDKPDEIEAVIIEALELYYNKKIRIIN